MYILLCIFRLGGVMMERLTIDEVIEHCNKTCDMTEKIAKSRGNELENIESNQFWEHYQVRAWLKELKQYKDLEEQGLLLRLPTEAYFIKDNIVRKGWVQELVYSPCRKLLLDIRYDDNSLDSYRGYVGNTAFLTQAEAEQKLKEMEND